MSTTVTAATLKARWPTFGPTADAVVTAAIAEAERRTDARVFGDRFDDAVALRAAHNLSIDPGGQNARLTAAAMDHSMNRTTYGLELKSLMRERAGGAWTAGQGPRGML